MFASWTIGRLHHPGKEMGTPIGSTGAEGRSNCATGRRCSLSTTSLDVAHFGFPSGDYNLSTNVCDDLRAIIM